MAHSSHLDATKLRAVGAVIAALASVLMSGPSAHGQAITASASRPMITQPITETNLARLAGSTRPEANAANDRGIVADSFAMEHMLLQLTPPAGAGASPRPAHR